MTTPDPMAELMNAWRKATENYVQMWEKTLEAVSANPAADALKQEATKTYLGTRSSMAEAARELYEPMIEMAGGVPMSDFRRLADEVHTVLQRLDVIDDRLRQISQRLGE